LVMLFFTLYPQCCKVFLSFLLCAKIDGKYYMRMDYREHCYDERWSSYAAIAIPGLIVYVIGTPTFFLTVLYYMAKSGILYNPANSDKFAFLFINFKPDFWWFAIYGLLVKCVMCGIIMFIWKGSATQVAVTFFFSIIFMFVAITTAPFKNTDLNANARLTTSTMVLTLYAALCLKVKLYEIDDWNKGVADGFIMAVNFITMVLFIYKFVRVQGNFLCEQYFPKRCQQCFLSFNRMMGWKPMPEPPPPPEESKEADTGESVPLMSAGAFEKKPNDFWQQTFKVVS